MRPALDHEGSHESILRRGRELEAKKAAAVRRDQIDAELAKLDAKDVEAPPAAVDSYVANMARFLGLLGYTVDDRAKELIAASRDWLKGIGVELLAAFGPAALLTLLSRPAHPAPQTAPQAQRKPEEAAKAKPLPIVARNRRNACSATSATVATSQSDDTEIACLYRPPPGNRSRRVRRRDRAL